MCYQVPRRNGRFPVRYNVCDSVRVYVLADRKSEAVLPTMEQGTKNKVLSAARWQNGVPCASRGQSPMQEMPPYNRHTEAPSAHIVAILVGMLPGVTVHVRDYSAGCGSSISNRTDDSHMWEELQTSDTSCW